jgi:hypothetical protein
MNYLGYNKVNSQSEITEEMCKKYNYELYQDEA